MITLVDAFYFALKGFTWCINDYNKGLFDSLKGGFKTSKSKDKVNTYAE